jgi:hypothetical protein
VVRRILVLNVGARERELQLVGRLVVGRDPSCEISHDDSLLSRRHAEFVTESDLVTVRDLGSRNGVFVNGARVVDHVLEPDDIVQIGPLRGRFAMTDAPAQDPGEMDGDGTAVIRQVFAGGALGSGDENEDEDATRMVPAPRFSPADADADSDAEAPTRFIAAGAVSGPDAAAHRAPEAATRPLRDGDRLRGFIFGQVAMLAALVYVASGLPLFIWRQSAAGQPVSLVWILLPAAAALAGAYIVGTSIAGRVNEAAASGERSRS